MIVKMAEKVHQSLLYSNHFNLPHSTDGLFNAFSLSPKIRSNICIKQGEIKLGSYFKLLNTSGIIVRVVQSANSNVADQCDHAAQTEHVQKFKNQSS